MLVGVLYALVLMWNLRLEVLPEWVNCWLHSRHSTRRPPPATMLK